MSDLVFDIESDGLLNGITKVHCINMIDRDTGNELRFTDHEFYQNVDGSTSDVKCPRDGDLKVALLLLNQADRIAGHNIIGYDIPALQAVYPKFKTSAVRYDSQVAPQLLYPDLLNMDFANVRKGKLSQSFLKKGLAGRHSLKAWGIRAGGVQKADFNPKDYGHTWATIPFTQEMDDYCMDDVRTNLDVIKMFEARNYSQQALDIEMRTAEIIRWQERYGVRYDVEAANALVSELYQKQYALREQCVAAFPPWQEKDGPIFTPKVNNKTRGYVKGQPIQRYKTLEFNPGSTAHIANRFTAKYGWEPTEFTKTGLPQVTEEVLDSLQFPEAKLINEYKMVTKRLSQIADGEEAQLKHVKKGRIHGRVNTMGCVTWRMSHSRPNLGNVTADGKPYGSESRALFVADDGRVIVGADADALELCVLAHFLAKYDGGAYVEIVLNGSKEDGTDIHSRNRDAVGLLHRPTAKTWFYAFIYGAQDFKLGTIVMSEWDMEKLTKFYDKFPAGKVRQAAICKLGKRSRGRLESSMPAFKKLVDDVKRVAKLKGKLRGIDGRYTTVRSLHSALNVLCQGAGAVIMKQALIQMFDDFEEQDLDVRPLLNVHDEVQLSALPEDAERVGQIAADAIRKAGETFNFRCPLSGAYAVGTNWSQTH